ncbi:MAG: hypothetical protein HY985_02950 [Magnetospirillum sp.]|nr:hypothetical protein [Magnetospirillum sp.]
MRKFTLSPASEDKRPPRFAITKDPNKKAITGQQNTSVMSFFPTIKGDKRMEALRHYFHCDFATLLEADAEVLYWTTEAQMLEFEHEGKQVKFKPNFHIEERRGPRAVRLVSSHSLARQRQTERHGLIREKYAAQGVAFTVLTDEDVAGDPRLDAAKEIFYYRCWPWPDGLVLDLVSFAATAHPKNLGDLHVWMGGSRNAWAQLIALVAHGVVEIDLNSELSPDTPVISCKVGGLH